MTPLLSRERSVCRSCGLVMSPDMPPGVWTGHVHDPVERGVFDSAATVVAVGGSLAASYVYEQVGITSEAIDNYLRVVVR